MKVSELEGSQLNEWVARARGWLKDADTGCWYDPENNHYKNCGHSGSKYKPTSNPAQWADLIEGFDVWLSSDGDSASEAKTHYASICPHVDGAIQQGQTTAIAICRSVVASIYGDSVPGESK